MDSMCYECVATFRNQSNQKRRVIYTSCPMKKAYKDGLIAYHEEYGESADNSGYVLAGISVRDSNSPLHQWSWFDEYDYDAHKEGRVDGYALNAYSLEQLKNPDLIE